MRDRTRRRLLLTAASATGLAAAGTAPAHGSVHDGLVDRLRVLPNDRWVRRHGHRMLFVDGERAPAVAGHFRPGGRDFRTLWVPGGDHHVAVAHLSAADRAAAVSALARWTGAPLTPR